MLRDLRWVLLCSLLYHLCQNLRVDEIHEDEGLE